MRKRSKVILQWILVILLVVLLTCCQNLLWSVSVLSKEELQDPTLLSVQIKLIPTPKYGKDSLRREKYKLESESQMDYVPISGRNLSKELVLSPVKRGTSKLEKSHKAGSPNKVGMVRDDPPAQPYGKNDVGNIVQEETVVSGADTHKGFNEEYIRHFWKHPELYKKFNETMNALKSQEKDEHVAETVKEETNGKVDTKAEPKQMPYITIDSPKGKLGNQMFQVASLLGIAVMRNLIPIIPWKQFNIIKVFKSNLQLYSNIEHKDFAKFTDDNKTIEACLRECKGLNTHTNWTIDGYFQSFEYFAKAKAEVRDMFEIKDVYMTSARQFIQENVPGNNVKVAIHIRRQDYISSYQTKLGRVAATADYVKNAQKYFLKKFTNVTFLVVSDDQPWCHQNIHGDNVVFSTGKSIGTDLAIMTESDHVIISVGTFGWWGGWLAGGMVIYYKHYPRPGSYLDSMFHPKYYYPKNWIAME